MGRVQKNLPQGLNPNSFCWFYRHDSSHPSDEDLSPGTPASRALIQSRASSEFLRSL
jgi:hypothetical protein